MKTIALIASMDTKKSEMLYTKVLVEKYGCKAFLIDISTKTPQKGIADLSSEEILKKYGLTWKAFTTLNKADRIDTMAKAIAAVIPAVYKKGDFDGILSIGGGQNARMAAAAMKELPYGVPKLIVSPMISGKRILEQYVGDKDIMVMHSVVDFSGMNSVTGVIINSAVSAVVGMTQNIQKIQKSDNKTVVGMSMLGITTRGAQQAAGILEKNGMEVISFHANGTGGRCLENFIREGLIDIVLDMNLHELTCEMCGGYCTGANGRLNAAAENGIPIVFVPGAIDVIDYFLENTDKNLPERFEERKKVFHNANVCHTKTFKDEILKVAETAANRLNNAKGPVTVILPHKGFCEAGAPDGPLYDTQIDLSFINKIKSCLNKNIKVIDVDCNINDLECAKTCANVVMKYKNIEIYKTEYFNNERVK